jgi:hypothetical protein
MKGIMVVPERSCLARNEQITGGVVSPQIGKPRNTLLYRAMLGIFAFSGGW